MSYRYFILCMGVLACYAVQVLHSSWIIKNQEISMLEMKREFTKELQSNRSNNQIIQARTLYALERIDAVNEQLELEKRKIENLQFEFRLRSVMVLSVTAYTPTRKECDEDPDITAAMIKVKPGIVAVSRDLFESGWVFGKKVYIDGLGIFTIGDLMNKRWVKRIDILMFDKEQASEFGHDQRTVALLDL